MDGHINFNVGGNYRRGVDACGILSKSVGKFEPRVHVFLLKEEKTCEEFRCMVGDEVEKVKLNGLGVNDGNSSGHMWNDKRTTQTQRNTVVE